MYYEEAGKPNYIDKEENEKKIYLDRTEKLKQILGDGKVNQWKGVVDKIISLDRGAYLDVRLPCNAYLRSNSSYSNFIILKDTKLYQKLRRYSENSKIVFSGEFLLPPNKKAEKIMPHLIYYGETSFTNSGGMSEPEFIFKFTDFH